MATVLVVSLVAMGVAFGAGMAGANHPSDAPDLSEHADFQVNFPHATDHYPGDINEENGSIQYFASGADAFAEQDAEEGVYIDWIIVHAEYEGEDWIDYSACDTPNTEAFGIDRGNNNEGTQYDEDLVSRQKQSQFEDDGIIIEFYEWQDIAGDPPYLAPEDAIVAAQGEGSADGACLTVTDEPGWYQIAAFMNGTVADNGPDEQPSDSASEVSLELNSNYLYVCECDSEEEAREELGDPPGETSEGTPTPANGDDDGDTDDSTPEPTPTEADDDGDTTDDTTPEPTPTEADDDGDTTDDGADDTTDDGTGDADDGTGDADDGTGDADDDGQPGAEDPGDGTPTPGDGPGFTGLAAVIALLASALLAHRRR